MSFLYPYVLIALILPLLMGALALLLHRQAGHGWRQLVSPAHEQELVHRRPAWRTVLPATLVLLAFACAILAAARPINGYEASGATATGRNLLIALDISRSMETQDVAPSRLEEARAAAYELIDALPGDKIGLMVFSGEADLVVPLTYDHTALRDTLEQINRSWAGSGGTNFGMVLRRAMADFSRSAPDGTNALVILSDGEDTVDSSLDIAEEARRKNLLVITVGIGTEAGGAIPDPKGENGLWQDADGKHVISKLQVRSLRQFAEATGGDFFLMGSGTSLSDFARKAVDKLDRHEEVYSSAKAPRDLFAWFAGLALLLLTAAILIGTEWKAPRHTALFLFLLLAVGGSPVHGAPENAHAQAYSNALKAKQEGKDADMVRTLLSQALLDEDKALQAASFLALGNLDTEATLGKLRSLYQAELSPSDEEGAGKEKASPTPEQLQGIVDDLKENLLPWQDALKADASFSPAQKNIDRIEEFIKKLEEEIERLKQQQNNQQQDNKDDQQQDNQQDNKDDQQQDNQQDNKDDQQQGGRQDNKDDQQQDGRQDNKDDQQQDGRQDNKDDQQQGGRQDNKDNQQQDGRQDNKDDQQQGAQQDNKDDQQGGQQDSKDKQPPAAQPSKLSDTEKARQRAASILQMHVDEEKGSPIPHFNDETRPPEKDY